MPQTLKHSNTELLKLFFPYLKKYKGWLALDLFCASLTELFGHELPLIVRDITDAGINDVASLTIKRIASITGFYLILRCIDAAANYFMASGGHIMGAKIETDMRNDIFSHLQTLSYSFYDNAKIGQLMSRVTTDLFDISEFAQSTHLEY